MYDPDTFRVFCISSGAKRLFDIFLTAMTTPRQSTDRRNLNKKELFQSFTIRAIASVKHVIPFKSITRLETAHLMGHSCARRTVNNIIQPMAETHYQSFEHFVTEAIEHC